MQRSYRTVAGLAVLAVLVTAGVVAGFGTAGAQTADSPAETISVSATGNADATPDQALVRVSITANGDDPAVVRDELASGTESLRDALDEQSGVKYETERYSIHERPPRRPVRDGTEREQRQYEGTHSFEVTVDDPDDTGAVVDAAAGAGAEIDNVELTLSNERREELRDAAIENAMSDARHQASVIASSANLNVVGVASVDASQRGYRPIRYETTAAGGDGAAAATVIEGGSVSVSYDVSVTYNAANQ